MGKIIRDLVEYNGISTHTYCSKHFKQVNIEQLNHISNKKTNVDQILKVWANANVIDTEIIVTPIGRSIEGQISTGKKLLVSGDLELKIEYISSDNFQSIYVENIVAPFGTYVVLPHEFNEHGIVSATALIEDISSLKISSTCIYNNITLLAIADIY